MHGGKSYLKEWLISLFPKNYEQMRYVEPCGGACSVLLNKLVSREEIYNDLDHGMYNLFYYLKTQPDEFIDKVKDIDYSQDSFEAAKNGTTEGLEGAVNELVLRRMSRGGLQTHFSWSERKRGGRPGDVNAWINFKTHHLPKIAERFKDVQVMNKHVVDLVHELDAEDVLWYIDPPYLPSTRSVKSAYNVEMSEEEHILLSQLLKEAKGKMVLSGYYSPLYAKLYKGWTMQVKEIANHSAQSKKKERRLECVWTNY
jgi:DNA adenine methylase